MPSEYYTYEIDAGCAAANDTTKYATLVDPIYKKELLIGLDRDIILKFNNREIRLTPKDIKEVLFALFPAKMAAILLEK